MLKIDENIVQSKKLDEKRATQIQFMGYANKMTTNSRIFPKMVTDCPLNLTGISF